MLIKVCGITEKTNALELKGMVDLLGFIFYPPSPRNAFSLNKEIIKNYGENFETIGVFVDYPLEEVVDICRQRNIHTIQLHGKESVGYLDHLKQQGFKTIKVISITSDTAVSPLQKEIDKYHKIADILLFDTGGKKKGGNGYKFDWNIFQKLTIQSSYLLSGGISSDDVTDIKEISSKCPELIGVDINSRFELSPGEKDIALIKEFTDKIKRS